MLILRLATDVRLIDFDRSEHEQVLAIGEGDADAMTQMRGGFLTDAEVVCQLGAGLSFQAREHWKHGDDPDPATQG